MQIYSVHDELAEEWWPPFSATNNKSALRAILQRLMENKNNPKEFKVYRIGNEEEGHLVDVSFTEVDFKEYGQSIDN